MVDLGSINRPVANQFDWTSLLQLMQQRELNELRKQEAQIDLAQKRFNLDMGIATKGLQIEYLTERNASIKASAEESRKKTEYLDAALNVANGMQAAIGQNPTMDHIGAVAGNIPMVEANVGKSLPRSTRGSFGEGGLAGVAGAQITGAIDAKLSRGDMDAAEAVQGFSEYFQTLQPFFQDEFYDRSRTIINRNMDSIGTRISSLPSGALLRNNLFADVVDQDGNRRAATVEDAMDRIAGLRLSLRDSTVDLGRPIFGLDEFSGKRNGIAFESGAKEREYLQIEQDLAAATEVQATGAGVVTQSQRRGIEAIFQGLVDNVFDYQNPAEALKKLGDLIEKTHEYPRAQASAIFDAAQRSADPVAQLRASQVFEALSAREGFVKSDLYDDIRSKSPVLFERLKIMQMIRRGRRPEEIAAMSSEGGQGLMQYAAILSEMTDSVMSGQKRLLREQQARETGLPDNERTVPKFLDTESNTSEGALNRTRAGLEVSGQFMGDDAIRGLWSPMSILDDLDFSRDQLDRSGLLSQFQEDVWIEMSNFSPEEMEQLSMSSRAEIAKERMRNLYHEDWLSFGLNDVQPKITRHHPVKIARGQGMNMTPRTAALIARLQLDSEFVSQLKTEDGEYARLRISDITYKPTILVDGKIGYYLFGPNGEPLGLEAGDHKPWHPDYSLPALLRLYDDVRAGKTSARAGGLLSPDRIMDAMDEIEIVELDKFLGSMSPRHREQQVRSQKRTEDLLRQRQERAEIRRQRLERHPP